MATSPPMIGGSDPSVLRSLETPTPSVARTTPPTVSATTGSATSGGTAVARGIAPQVSGDTTTYNQATQTASGTSLSITSATSNEPADVVTVYNTNRAISVSSVNQTVNSYKVNNYAGNEYTDSDVANYLPTFTGNVGAGNVNVTGTVYTSGISSTGSASLTILNVSTTANLGAVGNIIITGGTAGQVLSTNGSGVLSWASDATTYGNSNVVGLMGAFGSNTISTTGNITGGKIIGIIAAGSNAITTTANITGGNLLGPHANGNSNVNIPAANGNVNISAVGVANILVVTGTGSNITGTLNVSGNATVGNLITSGSGGNISSANVISANTFLASNTITSPQLISNIAIGTAPFIVTSTTQVANLSVATAGTVTTAAQPNITSVGTLTGLNVNGTVTAVAFTANTGVFTGSGNGLSSIVGANVTGQVGNALVAGTVYTNAQPNITSTGSLTGLTVSNATGVVDFTTTANVTLGAVANLHISGGTNGYVLSTDGAGAISWVAQSGGGGSPGGSNTQVQFNDSSAFGGNAGLTFDKSTTRLTANNFVATSTANLGSNANVIITGGTNGYVLSTDGSGTLSWIASGGGGGASISNGTSNVNIAASGGNITMGVGGVANVVVVSTAGISAALKPRVVVITDGATVTINADITDMATQENTGTGTLTVNAPTGTPYDGQKLLFRIKSTNSLTFSFNAIFIGSTDLAPPTVTSGGSKFDYMGWMYNSGDTKWNLISRNFGFV